MPVLSKLQTGTYDQVPQSYEEIRTFLFNQALRDRTLASYQARVDAIRQFCKGETITKEKFFKFLMYKYAQICPQTANAYRCAIAHTQKCGQPGTGGNWASDDDTREACRGMRGALAAQPPRGATFAATLPIAACASTARRSIPSLGTAPTTSALAATSTPTCSAATTVHTNPASSVRCGRSTASDRRYATCTAASDSTTPRHPAPRAPGPVVAAQRVEHLVPQRRLAAGWLPRRPAQHDPRDVRRPVTRQPVQ
jgi:hypothetical protein